MNSFLLLSTLNLSLGGLVFLLGLIILRENAGQRLNRVVALMLFFGGFGAILAGFAFLAARQVGAQAPGTAPEVLRNVSYLWEFFFPTLFLFASIFPEERPFVRRFVLFPGRWWTPGFGTLVFAPHAFHFALTVALAIWKPDFTVPDHGLLKYVAPLFGIASVVLHVFLLVHTTLFSLVNLGFGIATMILLFSSYRRARVPRLRQQLRVIAIGLSACLVCYSLATSIPTLLNIRLDESVRAILIIAALTLGPGSIAFSIVRYKFLDARLLARRAILYALVSGALVGVYLLVVSRLNRLASALTGVDARVFEPVFLIMALALFQPAIARLEELLDRMLLKDPNDYRNVLRQLGVDLQTTIDLEVLLTRTIRTVAEALLTRRATIVARAHGGAVAHTGAGQPLAQADLDRVASLLPRLPVDPTSLRLADRIEGLDAEDQSFLAETLGFSLVVPMRWRDELVGALLLGDKLTGTDWTSEDVNLLTTLAGRVSVSMQNALLLRERVTVARFEEELNLARQIQRKSLLSDFPVLPGCEVHALSIPSKAVGGDLYDVVDAGDGCYLLAIADVSGKGVPAALLSSMLQAALRTQAGSVRALPEILRNINTLMFRSTEIQQFATYFLARIDTRTLQLTFSNAGHNWPVLMRRGGERVFLDRGGTILGIMDGVKFEEGQVSLRPGDRVVLYTDGISEASNLEGEQFGEDRLYALVESLPHSLCAREVAESLLEALHVFLGPVEPQDDMTLLVIRALEPAGVESGREPERETVTAL
jgi:sigma-B regulation protein RsbU (phosphoserine phosphatase)